MHDFVVSLLLLGAISSQGGSMPFWATANQFGVMPDTPGGMLLVGAGNEFDESRDLQWRFRASVGLRTDKVEYKDLLLDELGGSVRWKSLRLDAGMLHPEQGFLASDGMLGTLSTTGGRSIITGNARSMPGYSLVLEDWNVPFTKGHLQLFGRYGDYWTTGVRHAQGALVHETTAGLRVRIGEHFSFSGALLNYAMWGGVSPIYGESKVNWDNYFRVITGRSGGADATSGDKENALGDHRGCEIIRLDYETDDWSLCFQHDRPYDDKSGMKFRNFPDAVNTLSLSFRDKTQWVSDILYEFTYTLNQSGTEERRYATEAEIASGDPRLYTYPDGKVVLITGGADNYYNNYFYRSGWTNMGRTIGNPLFFPRGTVEGTWNRRDVCAGIWSNMLQAHHLGVSGSLWKILPYKLLLTYSLSSGAYYDADFKYGAGSLLDQPLAQFSSALLLEIPLYGGIIKVVPAVYYDRGEVLPESFGATLSVKYSLEPSILKTI